MSEPTAGEQDAIERLRDSGDAIITGIERCLPRWVEGHVRRILDAWGRTDDATRARVEEDAKSAGKAATARVNAELRDLFETDPSEQRTTPLEIVRTAVREPSAILEAAGVPPVERDAFDERSFPEDHYGLVPQNLGDLGDGSLAPLHLVWGMAKAAVLRARAKPR